MKEFDLLVIGEINPDLILHGDVTPVFNQTEKLIDESTLSIGSSSVIMACGAARLGLKTAFIGVVGDDVFGTFMLNAMRERDINVSHCVVDPHLSTGFSVILVKPDSDRAILTYSGSIAELTLEHIDQDIFSRARHLHLGGYFLLDKLRPTVPTLFEAAHRAGLTTSLDTNWDPADHWDVAEVLPHCDIFLPNAREVERITDLNLAEGAKKLAGIIPTVAVKSGAEGATAWQHEETVHACALSMDVVDTIGAGDSFDAGFIYGYLNNFSLNDSLAIACACGSLSTRSTGGVAAQATLQELRELNLGFTI